MELKNKAALYKEQSQSKSVLNKIMDNEDLTRLNTSATSNDKTITDIQEDQQSVHSPPHSDPSVEPKSTVGDTAGSTEAVSTN